VHFSEVVAQGSYAVLGHTVTTSANASAQAQTPAGLARVWQRSAVSGIWSEAFRLNYPQAVGGRPAPSVYRTSVDVDGRDTVVGVYADYNATTVNQALVFDCQAATTSCGGAVLPPARAAITPRFGSRIHVDQKTVAVADSDSFHLLSPVVNGGWGSWGAWGTCSTVCGTDGIQYRSRTCSNPYPENGGTNCTGPVQSAQQCEFYTYAWITGSWGGCQTACGTNTQVRTVNCRRCDGVIVGDSLCDAGSRPPTSQSCTVWTFSWVTSGWTSCPTTCGVGVQTRTVSCIRCDGQAAASSSCSAGSRPTASQSCESYTYDWTTPSWSPCSGTCPGLRTRNVQCLRCDGAVTVADSFCFRAKPATTELCTLWTYAWSVSLWASCTGTCPGTRSRTVSCARCDGLGVAETACAASGAKPVTSEDCTLWTYEWKTDAWGSCSASCGDGTQRRTVWCERCDGTRVGSGCDSSQQPADSQGCNLGGCGCFSAGADAVLADGRVVRVGDLRVGDSVLTPERGFARVGDAGARVCYVRHRPVRTRFVRVETTSGHAVELTESHLVYRVGCSGHADLIGQAVQVGEMRVGECVRVSGANGTLETAGIASLKSVERDEGVVTVLTESEMLMAGGIAVSSHSHNELLDSLDRCVM
jgi:hypothetical protein